jgi:hypothetical protein
VPGEPITLLGDTGGRVESFVCALTRFPTEPRWALIGGFAVNVRIAQVHRLTNDIDTVSHDQASLVEILLAEPDAEALSAAKLRFTSGALPVDIDVMGDMADVPLAGEPSEQAFTLARRMALKTSETLDLVVVDREGQPTAQATTPVATAGALIALKAVAVPRRSASNNPQKVGSDIHDLVRLVQGCDFQTVIDTISTAGSDLQTWVSATLIKWFSPDHDLRYTFARMTRLTGAADATGLVEADLTIVADLGHALSARATRRSSG